MGPKNGKKNERAMESNQQPPCNNIQNSKGAEEEEDAASWRE